LFIFCKIERTWSSKETHNCSTEFMGSLYDVDDMHVMKEMMTMIIMIDVTKRPHETTKFQSKITGK